MLEISVQSACWYTDADPNTGFKLLRDCGFEAVDFNIDNHLPPNAITKGPLTDFYNKSIEELVEFYRPIKAAADQYGIQFAQMHAPFPLWVKDNEEVSRYMITVMEKTLAVAQFLGCPAVVAHPITRSTKEKEHATNLAMYRAMIPAARKYGVKVCLENLFSNFKGHVLEGACSSADEACWYIDTLNAEAGAECFGFCLDVGHANLVGRNIREYINTLGKRLTILHLHDNNGATDSHMMPYTQTHNWGQSLYLDWEGVIEGLRDIDYRGALNFETFRVLQVFPQRVKPEVLKLIAALGAYFRERILTPKEEV